MHSCYNERRIINLIHRIYICAFLKEYLHNFLNSYQSTKETISDKNSVNWRRKNSCRKRNNKITDVSNVQMKYATIQNQSYLICGSAIKQKFDFFQTPYSSHKSNIYSSDSTCLKENFYNVRDIKAKMVCLSYHNQNVLYHYFIQLMNV